MLLIGIAWALFVAAMMTQGVLSAPLSDRILHGGAVGYGWINAGWASGAFVSVFYAARFIRRHGSHRSVTLTMSVIALSLFLLPCFAIPAVRGADLLHHGIQSRHGRNCPFQRDDGNRAPLHDGPGAEHVLLCGERAADLRLRSSPVKPLTATG